MGQDFIEFYSTRAAVDKHPAAGGVEYAHWKGVAIEPGQLVRVRASLRITKVCHLLSDRKAEDDS